MAYLYSIFDNPFASRALKQVPLPSYISGNLKYNIRPYQEEAFKRYIYLDTEDFDEKPDKPYHLLYNMATGSGKTLVMAGLILYLYEQGYRNFMFFVNSNTIINKTKENFLNKDASKYLFKDKIVFDGKEVLIKDVGNFDEADTDNINIHFTSIHKLHSDLQNTKENSITYEDFENRKIVLLADEAHHLSSSTKNKQQTIDAFVPSWENTVDKILHQNYDNILLEFTATLDYDAQAIVEKYQTKVIHKYDLSEFRVDKYSKEINLIRSLYDEQDRIIQALLLNIYRQELATKNYINLKPVILFKAKRTIKESVQNKENFHKLIDSFSAKMVDDIKLTSTVGIVQKAFTFFESEGLTSIEIAKKIKNAFKFDNCISANNDKEAEENQIKLNTLEDENNPIRAVFAVQKLNEGWDVLNLFDIVRLYEGQNSGGNNTTVGKTTLSEAQLIGRGARYFPFQLEEGQDKYKRKFDNEPDNDLKVLEELYYHAKDENKYIAEIRKALKDSGAIEDDKNAIQLSLELKSSFKTTDFYKTGNVVFNKRVPKRYNNVNSFADLGVSRKNIDFVLSSGIGSKTDVFGKEELEIKKERITQEEIALSKIDKNIIQFALSKYPFFYFDSLVRYFPNISSMSNFISSPDYLGSLKINFNGTIKRLESITKTDYLNAVQQLLQTIQKEIKSNLVEYEGSPYFYKPIHEVFKNKTINTYKGNEKEDGQFDVVSEPDWYVYNANYGTTEEKAFVKMFDGRFKHLEKNFQDIYLIRNEREVKIVDEFGNAFEPDFILFCKQKDGKELTYQVFIEPKGKHLKKHDAWKEEFLNKIRKAQKTINIDTDQYFITGVPFYNNEDENEFQKVLENTLGLDKKS